MVFLKTLKTAASESLSIWLPVIILSELILTLSHILRVTSLLSPVKTITRIPESLSLLTAILALSFGGSKNPIKPSKVRFFSSLTENLWTDTFILLATATTLKPCVLSSLLIFKMLFFISLVMGKICPSLDFIVEEIESISSTAPLVIKVLAFSELTITDNLLREKSKGISSTLLNCSK